MSHYLLHPAYNYTEVFVFHTRFDDQSLIFMSYFQFVVKPKAQAVRSLYEWQLSHTQYL